MAWTDVSRINFEEKMLWFHVLRRAVFDHILYKGIGKHKIRWQQAHRFIFGGSVLYGLDFEEVCGLFGWESEYFQRKVKELERHDIKKLESSVFKDCFDASSSGILTDAGKWENGQSVPLFAPYNYSKEYRSRMLLRSVLKKTEKRPKSIPPMKRWSLATA